MNDIIKDVDELEIKIKTIDERIVQLEQLSDDVKQYIKLLKESDMLNKEKKKLETKYYELKMRKCNHVLAETMNVVYGSKIGEDGGPITDYDKYHLIFNHYCLKCGCTTDNSIIFDIYRNIDLLFKEEPTSKVKHLIQTEIIEQADNFEVINCSELSTSEVARIWLKIRNDNSDLPFDELLYLFKKIINELSKKETNTNKIRSRVLPTSIYTHIK